jgi:hypothetical protein
MPLNFQYTFLLLAAGALLISGPSRRLALLGLVPVALGIAAIILRLGDGLSALALRAAERGAPLSFLQINSGLVLLGLGLVITASILGLISGHEDPRSWLATVLVGAGAAPMLAAHTPLVSYTGWLVPTGAALGIGGGGMAFYVLGRHLRLNRLAGWFNRRILDRRPAPSAPAATVRAALGAAAGFVLIWLRDRSPESAEHWAPLFMPLALLVIWHAAASRDSVNRRGRLVQLLLGAGFFGIFAGGRGIVGAAWLLSAAVALPLLYPFLLRPIAIFFWLPVAGGGLLVLTGGLASQVTYTILAAGGIAVAIRVYLPPD